MKDNGLIICFDIKFEGTIYQHVHSIAIFFSIIYMPECVPVEFFNAKTKS